MSQLKVDNITNQNDDGPVIFDRGILADGSQLTLKPTTASFDPIPLATNVGVSSAITIGFNQNMQFLGTGDIRIREGSASGTITTSFTTGVSTEISLNGGVLTINPKNDLAYGQTYFVTLPSVGIANTLGSYITALETYQFQTAFQSFNITGGDFEQVIVDSGSPTGYYKYNIFTTTGIATFSAPSSTADSFTYVLVGGGGGGGSGYDTAAGGAGGGGAGGVVKDYNAPNLPAGNYTVTIGGGGSGAFNNPQGTSAPPTQTPTNQSGAFTVVPTSGTNSSFGPTPVGNVIAYGGGAGGSGNTREAPESPQQRSTYYYNNWSSGFAPPQGPTFSGPPVPPKGAPTPSPQRTFDLTSTQWVGGGHPGGSGGGNAGAGAIAPTYYYQQVNYSRINVTGASGMAYPSPTQQGYPGGSFATSYNPGQYIGGSGGGGAGSAGGAGGIVEGPQNTAGPAVGGNGTPNPAFPGPGLASIQNFPTALVSVLGPTGLLGGGGGAGSYTTGVSSPWGRGGPGGGGDGGGYIASTNRNAERGTDGTGGGGGGGPATGGPTGTYPTPGPGRWTGQNGGSGIMMIRYAHPGS